MDKFKRLLEPAKSIFSGSAPRHWADLGCGSGVFTKVLAGLLPQKSNIAGIDRNDQQISGRTENDVDITFWKADFMNDDLPLSDLDGIMMANSFHFIKDKEILIKKLEKHFKDRPRFLIIEYDHHQPNKWEPYPAPFIELKKVFDKLNYRSIEKIGELKSAYGGIMYASVSEK